MRKLVFICLAALLTISSKEDNKAHILDMEWMLGNWEHVNGNQFSMEIWTVLDEHTFLGMNYTMVGSDTTAFEIMHLHQVGDHLTFIASPGGVAPTLFTFISKQGDNWIFENKEHDFPTQISYGFREGKMIAFISGMIDGKRKQIDFEFNSMP